MPLHLPNSRSSCLSHPLGAWESKGLFYYTCLTPEEGSASARHVTVRNEKGAFCLSVLPFPRSRPNGPQLQQVTRTLPSILECLIPGISKVRHTHVTEKKMKIQSAGGRLPSQGPEKKKLGLEPMGPGSLLAWPE